MLINIKSGEITLSMSHLVSSIHTKMAFEAFNGNELCIEASSLEWAMGWNETAIFILNGYLATNLAIRFVLSL
jgi:hypothetical protein